MKSGKGFDVAVFWLSCGHHSHLIENIYKCHNAVCCVCMLEIKTFVNSYRKRVEMNFFQIIINLIDQASHFGHMGVCECVRFHENQSNIHHRTDNIRLNMESMDEKNMDKVKHVGVRRAKGTQMNERPDARHSISAKQSKSISTKQISYIKCVELS